MSVLSKPQILKHIKGGKQSLATFSGKQSLATSSGKQSLATSSGKNFKVFDTYQKFCKSTAVYPKIGKSFVYPLIGLQGEVGEVSEKIKKMFRDDRGKLTKEKKIEIIKELGDVVWYISQLATEFEVKFSDVIKENIEKLTSRQERDKLHGSGDNR